MTADEAEEDEQKHSNVQRVLITDREIEVLRGAGTDNYRSNIRRGIQERIERLSREMDELQAAAPELAEQAREAVGEGGEDVEERVETLEHKLAVLEDRFEAYDLD